uniref:Uncharacterized protein n=1 Tax=Salmonella sp. TaxID=599 RepID=A0A482ETM6_SALSP|nr:hypothetical protein [Salmonella sp.]QBM91376.1 hypothetical protein NNIBIDOC_00043 [Salmonella sp.]
MTISVLDRLEIRVKSYRIMQAQKYASKRVAIGKQLLMNAEIGHGDCRATGSGTATTD